jgi:hypothetical protein
MKTAPVFARIQASAVVELMPSLFWDVMQRMLVVVY